MPLDLALVERTKLIASFFNSSSVALVSLGVFAPLIYRATSTETASDEKSSLLYAVIAICLMTAITLHFVGLAVLSVLQSSELSEPTDDRQ